MFRELIDYNPLTGEYTEFVYDPGTDETTIINGQENVSAILDANKALLAEPRFRKNGEEFRRVARIPNIIDWQLRESGRAYDSEAMRRWLNDIDNRHFRTTNEVV